ncbi:MAG: hypothetical protein GEU99_12685 [Luteitalea sp.]|nr:hypothetical protein [Luteitalea sp.]
MPRSKLPARDLVNHLLRGARHHVDAHAGMFVLEDAQRIQDQKVQDTRSRADPHIAVFELLQIVDAAAGVPDVSPDGADRRGQPCPG